MSTRSGPCAPLLLLSDAASRLPASFLCVGVPVFVFCSAPLCAAPLSLYLPPLTQVFPLVFGSSLSLCRFSRVFVPASRCFGLPRVEFVSDFLGATQFRWFSGVFPPPPCVWPPFVFGALSVVVWFVGFLLVGPLSFVLWVCLFGQSLHTWFVQYGSSGIAAMVLCDGYLTSVHTAATFY